MKCAGQQSKRNCQEKSISTPLLEILRGRVIFESASIKGEKEQVQTKKFSLGGECLDCNLSNMLVPKLASHPEGIAIFIESLYSTEARVKL